MESWEVLRGTPGLYGVLLVVLGAIAGSFSSAAIYRLPREDLSLLRPRRSFCPACSAQLRWYDNLPILSFLLLRGRCRTCGAAMGWIYLFNELFLGGLFLVAGWSWAGRSGPLALAILLVALTALWIAAVVDWKFLILPDEITLGGIPFGFLVAALVPGFQVWDPNRIPWGTALFGLDSGSDPRLLALASAALGCLCAFLLLLGIRGLFSYLLKQEALGLGDVKFMASVGALTGLEGAAWTMMVGVMLGALLGLFNVLRMIFVVAARRRARRLDKGWRNTLFVGWLLGRRIPFGPPLVLGTVLVLLAPDTTREFFLRTWPHLLQAWLR